MDNNKDEAIYPEDKDWVNITVDRHDGWADDVSLVYKDDDWKPAEDELTFVPIDEDTEEVSNPNDNAKDSSQASKYKLPSKFTIFMIFWNILLISTVVIMLISYHDRLGRYELAYISSRPESAMDNLVTLFEEGNVDAIYGQITNLSSISEFENELTIKSYIAKNIASSTFTYERFDSDTDENVFTLMVSQNAVATVTLYESASKPDEFGFVPWYVTAFEYSFIGTYAIDIVVPPDIALYINDVLVSDDYLVNNTAGNNTYLIDNLLSEPSLRATDANGKEHDIYYNETDDKYIVK